MKVSGQTSYNVFFFSSRRRHTRFDCDWSSDVCSSDLAAPRATSPPIPNPLLGAYRHRRRLLSGRGWSCLGATCARGVAQLAVYLRLHASGYRQLVAVDDDRQASGVRYPYLRDGPKLDKV